MNFLSDDHYKAPHNTRYTHLAVSAIDTNALCEISQCLHPVHYQTSCNCRHSLKSRRILCHHKQLNNNTEGNQPTSTTIHIHTCKYTKDRYPRYHKKKNNEIHVGHISDFVCVCVCVPGGLVCLGSIL